MKKKRLGYYNFIHKFLNGETLVWNTYTGSVFLIGKEESKEFEALSGKWFEENEHYFVDSGVLVDEQAQRDQIDFILNSRADITKENKTITYTILTTTACNARCKYCFEKNTASVTMSEENLKKIVSFIENEAQSYEHIFITWFGGEPLLFKDKIDKIIKLLHSKCGSKKISCDIITNGSLFDEETARKAATEWFVQSAQITIDGTKENYEKIKDYINFPHAYSTVIQNIQHLINNDINVSIRVNVDKDNWKDVFCLIDELHTLFKQKIQIYPYPIFETGVNTKNLIDKKEFSKYLGTIFKKLKDLGYREKVCVFKEFVPWHCALTLPQNFVIMPDGNLLKCQSEVGQTLYIGNVEQGVIDHKRNNEYSKIQLDEECIKCCYLPICQGGCLASTKCESKIERCCLEKYYFHDLIEKYYLEEVDE